jgi:hypothetical protein
MVKKKTWLNLLALSNDYERRARLAPALTSLLPLLPLTISLGTSLDTWGGVLGGTTGVFALGWLALANLASAFGNRLQEQLWPDWPFDAPTNVRLMPDNPDTSSQQRAKWYKQIKKITGLDLQTEVEKGDTKAIRATVNDSVERLRNHFKRGKTRARHDQESIRYGYARNLTGMRPVWLGLSVVACLGSWGLHLWAEGELIWTIISTVVLGLLALLARILPAFVRTRARYYCEVFFQLLDEEAKAAWGEDAG